MSTLDLDVVTGTTLETLIQKESLHLGNSVLQMPSHAYRASFVNATNDPPGVETRCFQNGTNNCVATPTITSSSHRVSSN